MACRREGISKINQFSEEVSGEWIKVERTDSCLCFVAYHLLCDLYLIILVLTQVDADAG